MSGRHLDYNPRGVLAMKGRAAHPNRIAVCGSFVIAAVCKDGIIVASDSRANIFDRTDPNLSPVAYYDAIPKIFPVGRNALAETGQGLIGGIFFSALVNVFEREHLGARGEAPDELLRSFLAWCGRRLPAESFQEIKKQKLFGAGFVDGKPSICYFNEQQPGGMFGCIEGSGFVQSAPTSLGAHEKELAGLPCARVAALAKEAIREYASQGDRWKTIGGPIAVLLVTQSGNCWLENEPAPEQWTSVRDLIRDYKSGVFQCLHVIPPATAKTLEDLFATVA